MAWTQLQLDAVEAAIATGATEVEYADPGGGTRKVKYRSVADLFRLREEMAVALGKTAAPTNVYGAFDRDL